MMKVKWVKRNEELNMRRREKRNVLTERQFEKIFVHITQCKEAQFDALQNRI